MKDVWIAGAGIVFGWLMGKTFDDPGCRAGMAIFLAVTAVLVLAFAFAVVGHGRKDDGADPPPDDDDPR
jgi:hypothetical protein